MRTYCVISANCNVYALIAYIHATNTRFVLYNFPLLNKLSIIVIPFMSSEWLTTYLLSSYSFNLIPILFFLNNNRIFDLIAIPNDDSS